MKRILAALVLLCLSGAGGAAVAGDEASETAITRIPLPHPVPDETDWYGVYQGRDKQGFAMLGITYVPGDDPVYVSRSRIEAELVGLGRLDFHFETEDVFRGVPPFDLLTSREVRREGSKERRLDLRRADDGYVVVLEEDGREETRRLPELEYTLADRLTHVHWAMEARKKGDQIRVREFDITKLRHDVYTYRVEDVHLMPARGLEVTVYEVSMRSDAEGKLGVLWIDTEGRMVRGPLAGVAEMRVETEKQARERRLATDLFGLGRVPVNEPIGDPHGVAGLVLALYGRGASRFESGPRQHVVLDDEADRIVSVGEAQGSDAVAEGEREAALSTTPTYPADDPRIAALAAKLAGDWVEPDARVRALVEGVRAYLDDVHLAEPYPVLELLEERVGDSRDHARLFVALARALDVPAREVHGLVYLGDEAMALGAHAWCEVILEGRWVPVDPTWGQSPADGTHVALVRGGAKWTGTLAGLKGLGGEVRLVIGRP